MDTLYPLPLGDTLVPRDERFGTDTLYPPPLGDTLVPRNERRNENCSEEILWLFWCAMQKGFNLGGLWGIT